MHFDGMAEPKKSSEHYQFMVDLSNFHVYTKNYPKPEYIRENECLTIEEGIKKNFWVFDVSVRSKEEIGGKIVEKIMQEGEHISTRTVYLAIQTGFKKKYVEVTENNIKYDSKESIEKTRKLFEEMLFDEYSTDLEVKIATSLLKTDLSFPSIITVIAHMDGVENTPQESMEKFNKVIFNS